VSIVPVRNKSFKTADTYGLALDSSYTLGLALRFLRTYASANCGKRGGLIDDLVCALEVALFDLIDKLGDVDLYGTSLNARHILAAEATERLVDSHFIGITDSNLFKIVSSYLGLLSRHGVLYK
jgi:hypothetical protein